MKVRLLILVPVILLGSSGCMMAARAAWRSSHPKSAPSDTVITALDANHDGMLDAAEIANAPAALKTLDRNHDGVLTSDELKPKND